MKKLVFDSIASVPSEEIVARQRLDLMENGFLKILLNLPEPGRTI